MRAALVLFGGHADKEANLLSIAEGAAEAGKAGAELVVFPEAALTGLSNNDDPEHDLPLGEPIPGPVCGRLAGIARDARVWLALGILEREGRKLYDSALLFNPGGDLSLKYRRIQPQWHGKQAAPAVYCQGSEVAMASTPWGPTALALCGDLFDDGIIVRIRQSAPTVLLWLVARNFPDGAIDKDRWESGEEKDYIGRAALCGCKVLMVNALGNPHTEKYPPFGAAFATNADGRVIARWPAGREGIMHMDLATE